MLPIRLEEAKEKCTGKEVEKVKEELDKEKEEKRKEKEEKESQDLKDKVEKPMSESKEYKPEPNWNHNRLTESKEPKKTPLTWNRNRLK